MTAIALSAAVAFMAGTTSSFAVEKPISKSESKITEELWAVLNESTDDEMIPVYIWINDIDCNAVESKTIKTTGFSKEELTAKSKKLYEPLTACRLFDHD